MSGLAAAPLESPAHPRVSVIVATYNWSSVLPYSIGSVLRQTFADFEVLVVGDGCTDDSEAVVAALGDARVRWINLPTNTRHQSGPNNEGLRQARGEFIAYLGHDDLWLPHHLETMVQALESTGAELVHSVGMNLDAEGRSAWPTLPEASIGSFASPLCIVHRKPMTERIGGWRTYRDIELPPDVELWRRAHAAGVKFAFVPRLTALKFPALLRRDVYRQRPCHEQAAWLARIDAEPQLEATLLLEFLMANPSGPVVSYRRLVRHFIEQTLMRIRWRWSLRWLRSAQGPGAAIDRARRFKGLGE